MRDPHIDELIRLGLTGEMDGPTLKRAAIEYLSGLLAAGTVDELVDDAERFLEGDDDA